jgi:hypothetical protein
VIKELHSRSIGEHRWQGVSPTGGRGIDEPSALETLEKSTDFSRFEAQAANPVIGRYLASDGAVTPERLEEIVQGYLDEGLDLSRNLKLKFEGRERLVPLGEIQGYFEEMEIEDSWGLAPPPELVDESVESFQGDLGVEKVISLEEAIVAREEEIKRIEREEERIAERKMELESQRRAREEQALGKMNFNERLQSFRQEIVDKKEQEELDEQREMLENKRQNQEFWIVDSEAVKKDRERRQNLWLRDSGLDKIIQSLQEEPGFVVAKEDDWIFFGERRRFIRRIASEEEYSSGRMGMMPRYEDLEVEAIVGMGVVIKGSYIAIGREVEDYFCRSEDVSVFEYLDWGGEWLASHKGRAALLRKRGFRGLRDRFLKYLAESLEEDEIIKLERVFNCPEGFTPRGIGEYLRDSRPGWQIEPSIPYDDPFDGPG